MTEFTRTIREAVDAESKDPDMRWSRAHMARTAAALLLDDDHHIVHAIRSREIAREVDMAESSVFRIIGTPVVENFLRMGREWIHQRHVEPRVTRLNNVAATLVREETEPLAAVASWSEQYARYANPAAMTAFDKGVSLSLIEDSVGLMVARTGVRMPADYAHRTLGALAGLDVFYADDVEAFAQRASTVLVGPLQ